MKQFKVAPEIKVGSIFSKIDKNGKKHQCIVTWRSEYHIAYDYVNPYTNEVISGGKYSDTHFIKHRFYFDYEKQNRYIQTKYGNYYLEK